MASHSRTHGFGKTDDMGDIRGGDDRNRPDHISAFPGSAGRSWPFVILACAYLAVAGLAIVVSEAAARAWQQIAP